jgi:hypothetical protein
MAFVSWWMLLVVTVAVAVLAAYASWTAGRIDRLHHRVAAARARLDAELARRAALVAEMAVSGLLDPASSLLLMDAAHRARTASDDDREQRESALSRAIAVVDAKPEPWASELAGVVRRVQLARRFHNDLVVGTRNLRRRRLVRWLHLAGHAPMPATIELDDAT